MEKKCIICIFGNEDCGKTSSIVELHNLLLHQGCLDVAPKRQSDDVYAVVEKSGIVIGISSIGDPNTDQKKLIEELINNGCDIIVCAARGYVNEKPIINIDEIYEKNKKTYNCIFLSNYSINDYDNHKETAEQLSKLTAQGILDVIEYVINKNGVI